MEMLRKTLLWSFLLTIIPLGIFFVLSFKLFLFVALIVFIQFIIILKSTSTVWGKYGLFLITLLQWVAVLYEIIIEKSFSFASIFIWLIPLTTLSVLTFKNKT